MEFTTPQSRNEAIIQNELGANNPLEPAQSRLEELLLLQLEMLNDIQAQLTALTSQLAGLSFRAVTEEPAEPVAGTVYIVAQAEEESS